MNSVRTTLRRLSLVALVTFAACAPIDEDGNVDTSFHELSGAARRPRLQRIRDVAAAEGFTNGALLGGIAQVETGLSHCWSEATWACRGPNSSSCNNGPVIAGSADGPCSAQQGGLGMFQFDGGTYSQTLARDGRDILTLDGNIRRAVEFVINIVRQEVSGVSTRAQALAWMNGITIARGDARLDRWVAILACRYNGACGSTAQAGRYRDATLSVYSEVGAAFWRICTPTAEVCNGRDDDCDGRVDDGIAARTCGRGRCLRSVSCANGRFATCTPGNPVAETCNGVDDDCDGSVDEGVAARSCGVGRCRRTVACANGRFATCTPGAAITEVCGNGIDDDCDGMVDEGCVQDAGPPPTDTGPVIEPDAGMPEVDAGEVPWDAGAPLEDDSGTAEDAGAPGEDVASRDDVAEYDAAAAYDGGAEDEPYESGHDGGWRCAVQGVGTHGSLGGACWTLALGIGALVARRRRR